MIPSSLSAHHSLARPTFAQAAHVRRATLPPRLLLFLARIVARPEPWFVAGEPVAEAVAAVAAGGAANQALLRGPQVRIHVMDPWVDWTWGGRRLWNGESSD